jgi:hypothetical protein
MRKLSHPRAWTCAYVSSSSSAHCGDGFGRSRTSLGGHTCDGLQAPTTQLRQLCAGLQERLHERQLLVIVDDVWPEDLDLFMHQWLGLLLLQSGSTSVITSRSADAVRTCNVKVVPLKPISHKLSKRILHAYACPEADVAAVQQDDAKVYPLPSSASYPAALRDE